MSLGTQMLIPPPPLPCKLKNILFFPMFFAKVITVGILQYLPKQKRNTKSSSNPFNA
jgi:hypothetical protein